MKKIVRIAASAAALTGGLGLAASGASAIAHAHPAPSPEYHWCPGQWWDPGWGGNWDAGRCHGDHWYDGEVHDQGHWHNGPWDPNWR